MRGPGNVFPLDRTKNAAQGSKKVAVHINLCTTSFKAPPDQDHILSFCNSIFFIYTIFIASWLKRNRKFRPQPVFPADDFQALWPSFRRPGNSVRIVMADDLYIAGISTVARQPAMLDGHKNCNMLQMFPCTHTNTQHGRADCILLVLPEIAVARGKVGTSTVHAPCPGLREVPTLCPLALTRGSPPPPQLSLLHSPC